MLNWFVLHTNRICGQLLVNPMFYRFEIVQLVDALLHII